MATLRALAAVCVLVSFMPSTIHAARLLADESAVGVFPDGGEYADNRSIASALRVIPVEHSLIVTNDFSYPADNHRHTRDQFQLPAVFGHHCYACYFSYERNECSDRRLAEQLLLRAPTWSEGIISLARKNGWTHFLVSLRAPHASRIPLERVFQNVDYAVYVF